jgi:hypothetical protein
MGMRMSIYPSIFLSLFLFLLLSSSLSMSSWLQTLPRDFCPYQLAKAKKHL